MDRSAPVDDKAAAARGALAEQAVFTSIRSPLGQGYQLVAASAGISGDERKEILRCVPSHGSLCDPSPAAVGLASFELGSGRRCIFLSRNAGIEPTARGGYRTYTHVLVMEQAVFRSFQCDPLSIEVATLPAISADLPASPLTRLDPLLLSDETDEPRGRAPHTAPPPATADAARLMHILSAVLCRRRLLVVGASAPQRALRWMLGATPTAVRQRLSLSYGLKFSPSRGFQLVFAEVDRNETERITRDHEIEVYHWESPPAPARSPFEAWLRFVRQRWESHRYDALERLSTQLTQESSGPALERIVTLCADTERLRQADSLLLDRLIQTYSRVTPGSAAHAGLLADFQKAAVARKAFLARAQQESSAESEVPLIGHA